MSEIKTTYEQYCTNFGANVIMEEIIIDGEKSIHCTNENCPSKNQGCQNKLLQIC